MDTTLYEELELLADNTLPIILERNKLKKLKLNVDKFQSSINDNLEQLKQGIKSLSEQQSEQEQIGVRDTQTGEDQLIKLETKIEKLNNLAKQEERPREVFTSSSDTQFTLVDMMGDNGDILQLQQRIMEDQDDDLDQLTLAIQRQQELGTLIGEELETHAQLIEETEDMVERSDERTRQTKRKLNQINRKLKENKSICIIIAFILILFILVVLFH